MLNIDAMRRVSEQMRTNIDAMCGVLNIDAMLRQAIERDLCDGRRPCPQPGIVPCPCQACAERRQYEELYAAQCEAEQRHRSASEKSIRLLREWLSPAQLAQYDAGRWFDVDGSEGGRYRIIYGVVSNVLRYDDRGAMIIATLCFQPAGVPGGLAGDAMLAQKIMLENDEPAALRIANIALARSPIAVDRLRQLDGLVLADLLRNP